jgi:hypothetical protein
MSARSIALLVDSRQWRNRFGRYAGEILVAEGIGDVAEVELAGLTAEDLGQYGVVVLTACGATPGLEALLAAYVEGGGRLVLLRPDPALAKLAGVQPLHRVARGAGLLLNTAAGPGSGFPYDPLQIVGPLDLYRTTEAEALARVVTTPWSVEQHPAIVARTLGQGRIVAFLYDVGYTVARLRQGDPALADSDADGLPGVRPSDALVDQIAPESGLIPQAEVHQALLARTLEWLCPWPLPRLWYLPDDAQAILLFSGDGCGRPPDAAYLDEAALLERHGGTLSYYLVQDTLLTPAAAARLRSAGHELSIHPFAQPFSGPSMAATLAEHLRSFEERFGGAPRTVRHHCLQWVGWAEQAKLEGTAGLHLDLNCVTTRPVRNGYLFGAGRPLRFVDEQGQLLDTWQQPTQFEDDLVLGTHEISLRVGTMDASAMYDALLDEAVARWHTAVAVNLHPANFVRYSGDWARHIVAGTARRGVPMWSSERWLGFTMDRARVRAERPVPTGRGWQIRVEASTPSRELMLLVPERWHEGSLHAPAEGPIIELYGWRYHGLPLKGAPLDAEIVYA